MKRDILYSLLYVLFICFAACEDEPLGGDDDFTPGATSTVTATVEFKPLVPALNGASRSAGDAIKDIQSLWVLLYTEGGNLVEKYEIENFKPTTSVDRDGLTSGGPYAESATSRASFTLTVPQGRDYIYAVANLDLASYGEAIQTVEGLKGITLTWIADDVAKNSQMFGHFVVDNDGLADKKALVAEETVLINKNTTKLHAWVRRAASKVTVAYDASGLEEGVFVYLKSVRIKDIPRTCFLGDTNKIKDVANLIDGEIIRYYEGEDVPAFNEYYPVRLSTGKPEYGEHKEGSNALFFFENMQGEGKDKRQDADGNGALDRPGFPGDDSYSLKDDMPFGTYIEVDAYYVSINPQKVGSGPIKYRFMLGKDVATDYNAERNYHYKLTLVLKNFANDADWHIEYKEEKPGIEVPPVYYISYLYNRSLDFPIKINTGGGQLDSLGARIIFNNWAPEGASTLDYAKQYDYAVTPTDANNAPWHGFLSLRKTTAKILSNGNEKGDGIITITSNKAYYEETKRGTRDYSTTDGTHSENDGTYTITTDKVNKTVNITIPLYTRAKQMIVSSAYTGNNPYVAYQRQAQVEFTVKIKFDDGRERTLKDTAKIFQVRRVVNPKGIYRSAGNTSSFHVKLMRLPKEEAVNFEAFPSEGRWRAYIPSEVDGVPFRGDDFITLENAEGKTGSFIEFDVKFKGKIPEGEVRQTVIRVDYHDYTCQHLIFVTQGDGPVQLVDGGAKWHNRNLLAAGKEVDTPLDEGSLFRYGNLEQPIAASSQVHRKVPWNNVKPGDFVAPGTLNIVGAAPLAWDGIASQNTENPSWKVNLGANVRVANYNDYNLLFTTSSVEQGFGVLYGDGTNDNSTHTSIQDVYEYRSGKGGSGVESGYGMRGCFVYNKTNGKHVFFPIGASGYGRRRFAENGMLRYANRTAAYPDGADLLALRPLFYDLYRRQGAIYWLEKQYGKTSSENICGWDINYYTFDFHEISSGNNLSSGGSDACFIRCVEDN